MTTGEIMGERYQVMATVGRGVFSTVVSASDLRNNTEVAIKVIRSNETMTTLGKTELDICRKISENDVAGKKHCVRLLDHFEYRGHLCLVFERFAQNLRQVLKQHGKHVGLSISAVRAYGLQLLVALRHLEKLGIMHADIKPDNILVSHDHQQVVIADFGSASTMEENAITPYLVSRFYRAPEIIVGHAYDHSIDLWSIGCTLYEVCACAAEYCALSAASWCVPF